MTSVKDKIRPIRICVVSIALSIAFGSISANLEHRSAQDQKAFRHDAFLQADGGRQAVDDMQSERQHCPLLLLRRCGTELPSVWPLVHVGCSAATMSIIRKWLVITNGRRMAADGEALRLCP